MLVIGAWGTQAAGSRGNAIEPISLHSERLYLYLERGSNTTMLFGARRLTSLMHPAASLM